MHHYVHVKSLLASIIISLVLAPKQEKREDKEMESLPINEKSP